MTNANIKNFIDASFSNYISKNTITGIISSILKPVACGSVKALILSRMRNINEVETASPLRFQGIAPCEIIIDQTAGMMVNKL